MCIRPKQVLGSNHKGQLPRLGELARTFAPHGSAFAVVYADVLDAGLAVMQPYVEPDTTRLARALQHDLQQRWDSQHRLPHSLIHWDAHAANCLWGPDEVEKMAVVDYQILLPLQFAQQLRFFGTIQHWDDNRRHWVAATTPRVIAALHDAAASV